MFIAQKRRFEIPKVLCYSRYVTKNKINSLIRHHYPFYKYGPLWICIISHAVANLSDFILSDYNEMARSLVLGLGIACVVIFVVSVFITARTKKGVG